MVSGDVGVRNVDGVATMVHERSARVVSAHSESTVGVSVACQSKSTIVDQGVVDEGSEFEVGCECRSKEWQTKNQRPWTFVSRLRQCQRKQNKRHIHILQHRRHPRCTGIEEPFFFQIRRLASVASSETLPSFCTQIKTSHSGE